MSSHLIRTAGAFAALVVAFAACTKDEVANVGLGGPCSRNADCASPFVCIDAKCVPTPLGCTPGEKRCNGAAVEVCDAAGSTFTAGDTCATGCAGGACLPTICSPAEKRCNGDAIEACIPSGARYDFVQFCATTCEGGACKPPAQKCEPNKTRCNGTALEQCTPDGLGWAFSKFCDYQCTDGACAAQCEPNKTRCNGKAIEQCAPSGKEWGFVQYCDYQCTNGACEAAPPACTAGETRCSGKAVEQCSPDASGWSFVQFCATDCANGACLAAACRPFATRCQGPGIMETCAADGTTWVAGDCGAANVCENGTCRPKVCEPGTLRCFGRDAQACNSIGSAWETTANCAVNCANGACTQPVCTPGEKRCNGTAIEACATDGSAWNFLQYCATSCSAGACTAPKCAPLARRCNGKDVEVCDGGGNAWAKVDTCPDACTNGFCVTTTAICTAGDRRCVGQEVQVCAADGKSWKASETCVGACSAGGCTTSGCTGFSLSAAPADLPADGASTGLLRSGIITGSNGVPLPNGTLLTITVDGTAAFASADADPVTPGNQVATLGGQLKFMVRAPVAPGAIGVTASYAGSTVCRGQVAIPATIPVNGRRTAVEDFSTTTRRDDVATTATWSTAAKSVTAQAYDPTVGVNAGSGRDGDLVVPDGSTFSLPSSVRPGKSLPDVRVHTVTYIDTRYGNDFVTVDPPANGKLQPGDEVVLINLQGGACGSGNTCDGSVPNWSAQVGTYEFLTVREARGDGLLFFTKTIQKTYSNGGNADIRGQKIFVQRVPNYDRVTIDGTLTTDEWDPANRSTGAIFMRARRGVVINDPNGKIDVTGKGYRGGRNDKTEDGTGSAKLVTNSNSTGNSIYYTSAQSSGESYGGALGAYDSQPWYGGGGGAYATCATYNAAGQKPFTGGGGGYGTAGAKTATTLGAFTAGVVGQGNTYGDVALSKLFLGSGAGANGVFNQSCSYSNTGQTCWTRSWGTQCGLDTTCTQTLCCNCTNYCAVSTCSGDWSGGLPAGRGGGIVAIWAQSASDYNGGSGGSIYLNVNSAALGTNLVRALGAIPAWATIGARPPGDGRIAINYWDYALSGTTNPPAYANMLGVIRKNMAQSLTADAAAGDIASVKVLVASATTAGGDVTIYVSSDGGQTWTEAGVGSDTLIPETARATDLRWRALFRPLTSDPITLDALVFEYTEQ